LTNGWLLTSEKSQSDKMIPGGFGMGGLSLVVQLFESHGEFVVLILMRYKVSLESNVTAGSDELDDDELLSDQDILGLL
jgi:hypothetical protein